MKNIYEFKVKKITGEETTLEEFKGKVLLIVNTASLCGFTPQYQGLEELYRKYKDHGFVVLGFPCNQFGGQEPESDDKILEFCTTKYLVSFPMFSKIEVNGKNAHPLYEFLKEKAPGVLGTKAIKWNFTKFLVDRLGNVVKRFAPNDEPKSLEDEIKKLL
jgi:glutathione peroxidase